jgi:hypothetical protein
LGCSQPEAEEKFRVALDRSAECVDGAQTPGLLVSGGFGSGKSHLLGYLADIALQRNMVCSRVVISKETALYDPWRVFRAAVDSAQLPEGRGQLLQEITLKFPAKTPAYASFAQWLVTARDLPPILAASVMVFERLNDPEVRQQICDFWGGAPLSTKAVKGWVREIRQTSAFNVRAVPRPELISQLIGFASRLIRAAGYDGWVILLDEVELAGRYGPLGRARSYGELARWLGITETNQYPGILTVAAITDDFFAEVIERTGDKESARARLEGRTDPRDQAAAGRAEKAMQAIEHKAIRLRSPDAETLEATYRELRSIHSQAYAWDPPELEFGRGDTSRAMRSYVRRWINEWDLRRLYPQAKVEIQEEPLAPSYEQDDDLEVPPEADDGAQPPAANGV